MPEVSEHEEVPTTPRETRDAPAKDDGWGEDADARPRRTVEQEPPDDAHSGREIEAVPEPGSQADDDGWGEDEEILVPHQRGDDARSIATEPLQDIASADMTTDSVTASEWRADPGRSDKMLAGARREVAAAVAAQTASDSAGAIASEADMRSAERERLKTLSLDNAQPLAQKGHVSEVLVIEDGADKAFLKPARGEDNKRADIPQGEQWCREVAAGIVDDTLDFALIPPTVARYDPKYGDASLQTNAPAETRPVETYDKVDQQRLGVLDFITGQTDRHARNYRTQDNGRPAAIDNGYTFPEAEHDPLRSVFFPSMMNRPLALEIRQELQAVDGKALDQQLRTAGLSEAAILGVQARLAEAQSGLITGASYAGGYRIR